MGLSMRRFDEWNVINEKEKRLLMRCSDVIKKVDSEAEVILYGSRARGEAVPESDYDLLILVNDPVNIEKEDLFRRQLFPIELETGYVFTVALYNRYDWETPLYRAMPFHQNVEKDGVIL